MVGNSIVDSFPQRLRAERRKAKLSQEKLAKKIGVSQPTVSAWERGAEIKRGHYLRLLKLLPGVVGNAA